MRLCREMAMAPSAKIRGRQWLPGTANLFNRRFHNIEEIPEIRQITAPPVETLAEPSAGQPETN
jgi:hypothetical protein